MRKSLGNGYRRPRSLDTNHMAADDYAWHAEVCRRKVRYPSRRNAKDGEKQSQKKFGTRLQPYRCSCCGYYHLRTVKPWPAPDDDIFESNTAAESAEAPSSPAPSTTTATNTSGASAVTSTSASASSPGSRAKR